MSREIRDATAEDASAVAAIYAPYVQGSATSFEIDPPDTAEMGERMARYAAHSVFLVCVVGADVVGYAYGGPHRPRAAYDGTVEVSVYLSPTATGRGHGRALGEALLTRLRALGFRNAVAGITLPNAASIGLHEALGFGHVGVFHRVGHKFGVDHDVAWMERSLTAE